MKNKTLKRIVLTTCIIGGGLIIYGNSPKRYENIENTTYQGWTQDEGKTILIFDSKPLSQRQEKPEYQVLGDLEKLDLKIGEDYDLVVKIPQWAKKSVILANPSKK